MLSQKIQERIATEKLKPKPRWYFHMRKTLSSISLAAFTILGSISAGLIMEISGKFMAVSLIWFFVAISSLLAVIANFIKNFYGYRIRLGFVLAAFAIIIITFGTIFYSSGVSRKVESFMEEKVPDYPAILEIDINKFEPKKLEIKPENSNEKVEGAEKSAPQEEKESDKKENDDSGVPASNPVEKIAPKKNSTESVQNNSAKKKKKKHKKHDHHHDDDNDDVSNPVSTDQPCDNTGDAPADEMPDTNSNPSGNDDSTGNNQNPDNGNPENNNGNSGNNNGDLGDEDNNQNNYPAL